MIKKKLKGKKRLIKVEQNKSQKNNKSPNLTLRQEIANLRAELLKEREEKNKLLRDYKKQLTTAKSKINKLEKLAVKKGAVSLVKEPQKRKIISSPLKLTKVKKLQNYKQELRERGQGEKKRSFSELERLIELSRLTKNKTAVQK